MKLYTTKMNKIWFANLRSLYSKQEKGYIPKHYLNKKNYNTVSFSDIIDVCKNIRQEKE